MAQVIPPEILSVMSLRAQYRTASQRSSLPAKALQMIDTIRADIPSGEDGDGWSKVCRNWRTGGAAGASGAGSAVRLGPTASSISSQYRGSGGGGGGGGFRSGAPAGSSQQPPRTWDMRRSGGSSGGTVGASNPPVTTSAQTHAPTSSHSTKYVSPFKVSTKPVEATIVNTIILNKLNKFSPANYDEVKEFLMEILGSGERDFLTDFMQLVFRKAAAEETFCPLYARLLKELATGYPFLLNEMQSLYNKYVDIFQEVNEHDCANMEEFIQKNKEKKYRQGYSQFLAELLKHGIVEHAAFVNTIKQIIQQIEKLSREQDQSTVLEEYSNCLLHIFRAINKGHAEISSAIRADIAFAAEQLTPLTVCSADRPSLTNRIRFSIMNAKECIDG